VVAELHHATAEAWPPAAAQRASGLGSGDAVHEQAAAPLEADDSAARERASDAVDEALVEVERRQRRLEGGDPRPTRRRRRRQSECGDECKDGPA
jgi:hypothetical protein